MLMDVLGVSETTSSRQQLHAAFSSVEEPPIGGRHIRSNDKPSRVGHSPLRFNTWRHGSGERLKT
ncbi:hypothetical protein [Desulfurococcus amylolyticus]|uniref:hypothetical protein n=1 Tax=Desulfurococcus amylolyticus TaxID=94694 RepID=UPI00138979EF|nr:hypothetical protein [Desulfurococcus amylolyticus]